MHKVLLTAAIVILPLLTAAPAFAMKGIDAARTCNADPSCILLLNDSGLVTIIKGDDIIICEGPQADCQVQPRRFSANKPNVTVAPLATGGLALR